MHGLELCPLLDLRPFCQAKVPENEKEDDKGHMGIHVIIVLCSEHVEVLLENNLNNQPDTCKVGEQLLLY